MESELKASSTSMSNRPGRSNSSEILASPITTGASGAQDFMKVKCRPLCAIATMLGLALAIDYSLFIVSRYREELRKGRTVGDAVERAIATAGKAVVIWRKDPDGEWRAVVDIWNGNPAAAR